MKATTVTIAAALLAGGCFQIKTESEIKPIHITMDVNLKVDKDLDSAFAGETAKNPESDFKVIRDLLARKVAGVTNLAMLEARSGATDDDKIAIADANTRRLKRFSEIAKKNGTSIEAVQRRHVVKMRERASAGAWYQEDSGTWRQR